MEIEIPGLNERLEIALESGGKSIKNENEK